MQCTPEEIEKKRKLAQLKLARKKKLLSTMSNSNQGNLKNSSISATIPVQARDLCRSQNLSSHDRIDRCGSPSKPYDRSKTNLSVFGTVTATCSLVSNECFCVDVSSFSEPVIEIFRSIPSKFYDPHTRKWNFHVKDYELLLQKFNQLQPKVAVVKLPSFVTNCCKIPKVDYLSIDLSKIDTELLNVLMPFQQEGVRFGIDKNGRCLIGDDMGLGKTFQALGIASYYKENWPLLIVTTASMRHVWEETIHKYLPSVSVMHTQYMCSSKDYIGDANVLIVSHDLMSKAIDKLLERNFGVLVIDESHTLKNFKAKCTKAAAALAKKAVRVVLLSGTPALSRPSELFTQLSLIDNKFFGNFFEYSKRYCDGRTTNFGWDASGTSNLQELEIVLAKKFMIRRTKENLLKMLPNKKQEVVMLDVDLGKLSEQERRNLSALEIKYNGLKKTADKHAALLTFFSETASIKIPAVCSYVAELLNEKEKFLVFAHHQKMMDAIEQVLLNKKKRHIRIDGSTTCDQRKYFIDKFQYDNSYVCALLSITAANAGITLTSARLILFAELHWNPSTLSQAESRAHRIGQEGQVVVRYLIASGTADDSIWPMLQNKQRILREIGLSKDSFNDIVITKQRLNSNNFDSNVTFANTLDISTYFKSPEKHNNDETKSNDLFDDDCDEVLSNIPLDF